MTVDSPGGSPLSVLRDRPHVLQEIERHLRRYRRRRRPFSLVTVEIRNLGWFEDTLGRQAGNSVLGYAADFIRTHVREVDVWYLCTRDTYIIVMDETDAQAARATVERLATEARKKTFAFGTDRVGLELSFRTATCPDDGVDAEALLRAIGFPSATTARM